MSDEAQATTENAGSGAEESHDESAEKAKKKKKLIMIGGAAALVLALGGGGAFFMTKKKDPAAQDVEGKQTEADQGKDGAHSEKNADESKQASEKEKKQEGDQKEVYYDMEEFLVNLSSPSKQPNFLKMTITLELENQQAYADVAAKVPRIRDTFQVYLRELRTEDLQGSSGMYRLREELLIRINKITYPTKVKDLLFKQILVQ